LRASRRMGRLFRSVPPILRDGPYGPPQDEGARVASFWLQTDDFNRDSTRSVLDRETRCGGSLCSNLILRSALVRVSGDGPLVQEYVAHPSRRRFALSQDEDVRVASFLRQTVRFSCIVPATPPHPALDRNGEGRTGSIRAESLHPGALFLQMSPRTSVSADPGLTRLSACRSRCLCSRSFFAPLWKRVGPGSPLCCVRDDDRCFAA